MSDLDFLVLGDWGRRGTTGQMSVAAGMSIMASRLRPQFVVTTGDNFYGLGVVGCEDSHWHESIRVVYTSGALDVP